MLLVLAPHLEVQRAHPGLCIPQPQPAQGGGSEKSSVPGLGALLFSSTWSRHSSCACAELALLASLVETVELQQVQPEQTPKSSAQQTEEGDFTPCRPGYTGYSRVILGWRGWVGRRSDPGLQGRRRGELLPGHLEGS